MGCCRGRPKAPGSRQPAECKTLESGGARTVVQVLATDRGPRLVVATPRNGFLDLGSFLSSFKCQGPTAKMLRRYLPVIQRALSENPAAFAPYRSGLNVTDLIRVAERVTKGANSVKTTGVPPLT